MMKIYAERALTSAGWQKDVLLSIDKTGMISSVQVGMELAGLKDRPDHCASILLPAPVNLHSHAFQRAMAGMGERRGLQVHDTFWTWRQIMYRFLDLLIPDDVEAITAFVQMEMLEAGYACNSEFHYLHHQFNGAPYDNLAEMSERVIAAADQSGIGLTLLPVLYQYGGCDHRSLCEGQIRFGNDFDRFVRLHEQASHAMRRLPKDSVIGVAPHSLRAVSAEALTSCIKLAGGHPLHMHLAEQRGEVEEVLSFLGKRPVDFLLDEYEVTENWCLIHCTQMNDEETDRLAKTGAVIGLCPITEASLGDGIFNGAHYHAAGGVFGIGSDSNILISLCEELRALEYSQRLRDRQRAIFATSEKSTGRVLFEESVKGGAQAAGRHSGEIKAGNWADLLALDGQSLMLESVEGDEILDNFIFAAHDRLVRDVWSAGRHLVTNGRHLAGEQIRARYRDVMKKLRQKI